MSARRQNYPPEPVRVPGQAPASFLAVLRRRDGVEPGPSDAQAPRGEANGSETTVSVVGVVRAVQGACVFVRLSERGSSRRGDLQIETGSSRVHAVLSLDELRELRRLLADLEGRLGGNRT